MGKFPVRLKEVVYTVSPFEVSVLSGLWKDLPEKISRKFRELMLACWARYANDYKEKEKMHHRF